MRPSDRQQRASPTRKVDVTVALEAKPIELDLGERIVSTWAYGDQVPGSAIRAKTGDLVEVRLANRLPEPTSIHWHGLAIVNEMDGVPDVTQRNVEPGTDFTYRFVVPDAGTYWFHPHHGLQLERGLYAPFIITGSDEPDVDAEYVIVLDDWLDGTGTTPEAELARIREMGQTMTADTSMDMGGMDMGGMGMGGMGMATSPLLGGDAGDATHPYQLLNGRPISHPVTLDPQPTAGSRVRLRVINASGDTAYRVAVGGHRLTVTHTDGFPVQPVEVDAFLIGMGERYDVVLTVASGAWPIVASAEGKDQRAGAILRTSDATATTAPDLTAAVAELDGKWLRYSDLHATESAVLTPPADARRVPLRLTGGMGAYDWGINGRTYGNHQPIEVASGEWVTLDITNETMMWHPIHLHGHTGQLGTTAGGPRKDTVNVLPMTTQTLTFQANNPGTWMVHCHNAYHLEAGMATLLTYQA